MIDAPDYLCARCDPDAALDVDRLAAHLPPAAIAGLRPALADALAGCVRCLDHDGVTIDRAHVEAVHAALGPRAVPLAPWLAARARAARPELAGAATLVATWDAVLVHPREAHQRRLDTLLRLHAPDLIVDEARAAVAEAATREVRLAWEAVFAWPAPAAFPGTVGFGAIARVLAATALPAFFDDAEACTALLAAIDQAIDRLELDDAALAARHRTAALAQAATGGDLRRARGLELAVRMLDELGHTDLRDNQDTLVDDLYFSLKSVGLDDAAAGVYRRWLTAAVPAALAAIG